jgi:hypothetical protein
MGKHNGKARSTGLKVGAALANRAKKVSQRARMAAAPASLSAALATQLHRARLAWLRCAVLS